MSKLDGIIEQVDQNLPEPGDIPDDARWNSGLDEVGQVEPFVRGPGGNQIEGFFNAVAQREGPLLVWAPRLRGPAAAPPSGSRQAPAAK